MSEVLERRIPGAAQMSADELRASAALLCVQTNHLERDLRETLNDRALWQERATGLAAIVRALPKRPAEGVAWAPAALAWAENVDTFGGWFPVCPVPKWKRPLAP